MKTTEKLTKEALKKVSDLPDDFYIKFLGEIDNNNTAHEKYKSATLIEDIIYTTFQGYKEDNYKFFMIEHNYGILGCQFLMDARIIISEKLYNY